MTHDCAHPRYPIGIQSFRKIRENDWAYVDKTRLIYQIANRYNCVFLSRPRRFGKSLTASTLAAYFKGEKQLFAGLDIERLEYDWAKHPVLLFDLSTTKDKSHDQLVNELWLQLKLYDIEYDLGLSSRLENPSITYEHFASPGTFLRELLYALHRKSGRKPVVIIDEYDAPLLNNYPNEQHYEAIKRVILDFYAPIKACDEILRFVFITGITKFSQLSIFSTLNNMIDISMMPEYASMCGITEQELTDNFSVGIAQIAERNQWATEQVVDKMREYYCGYRFSRDAECVYNPHSLVCALEQKEFGSHWFATGSPNFLLAELQRFDFDISSIERCEAEAVDFDAPTDTMTSPLPLLYQSGYVTIVDYDADSNTYVLGTPNKEVRIGLYRMLLPRYTGESTQRNSSFVISFSQAIIRNEIDDAMRLMQTFLSTLPYDHHETKPSLKEKHYHSMFYIIFSLLGNNIKSEVKTALGRIDAVVETHSHVYVFELKLDGSAQTAIEQIESKGYMRPYERSGKQLTAVGVNFSSEQRTISDWKIQQVKII